MTPYHKNETKLYEIEALGPQIFLDCLCQHFFINLFWKPRFIPQKFQFSLTYFLSPHQFVHFFFKNVIIFTYYYIKFNSISKLLKFMSDIFFSILLLQTFLYHTKNISITTKAKSKIFLLIWSYFHSSKYFFTTKIFLLLSYWY